MPFVQAPLPLGDRNERAEQLMVRMRDGTCLATDVYLPARSNGGPVVLVRTMYDKASLFTFVPLTAEYLNDHGYTVVAQDVRGKGGSEGDFRHLVHEVDDGFDTLEWLVAQPWCDGEVVMFGESYFAYTAWAAVASGHPAVRAIVPRCVSTDMAGQLHLGGAFNFATMAVWAPYSMNNRLYTYEGDLDWSVRPLKDIHKAWLGDVPPVFAQLRSHPGSDVWRDPRMWAVRADRIRVPALHIGAWWDEWRGVQLRDWRIARASTRASQFLRMEVADHQGGRLMGDDETPVSYLDSEDGMRGYLPRYLDPVIEFFDREVRGVGADASAPLVTIEVAEGGIWRGETWPPPSARTLRLHLADAARAAEGPEGGALSPDAQTSEQTASWTHDPSDLVPFLDQDPVRVLSTILPDERDVEQRPDVLTFTADPVREPMDLMGPVHATLSVTADAPIVQVTAKLVDVYPNGRARRICEGVRQLERPDPTEPVQIDLIDIGYRLRPGHQLRLEVAASGFPRWMPVIDPHGDSWSAVTGPTTQYRLRLGGNAHSHLDITIADETLEEL